MRSCKVERLTAAAKLLVEAVIEGKVTEDELKTAQEALQRGDREPCQISSNGSAI